MDTWMEMVHPDLPDSPPVRVEKRAFEMVWKEQGWRKAPEPPKGNIIILTAEEKAALENPPDKKPVTKKSSGGKATKPKPKPDTVSGDTPTEE